MGWYVIRYQGNAGVGIYKHADLGQCITFAPVASMHGPFRSRAAAIVSAWDKVSS